MRFDTADNIFFNNLAVDGVYLNNELIYPLGMPTNGLLFHYDPSDTSSYPGTGTTVTDLSGNGNNGTLTNGVGFSSDLFTFDGNNDYIDLPNGFADFTNGFSFFAIANFGTVGNWERLFDFGNGQGNNNILLARRNTTNDITFELYNGTTSTGQATVSNGVLNSTLAFYGVTLDGTNCRIYRNGSLLSTISYPYLPSNITRTNNYIGRSNWSVDAYFQTTMGPVGMYDRTISETEMNRIYDLYSNTYSI